MMDKDFEKLENLNIQDIAVANVLGINKNEVLELDLFQMKNKLQQLAWRYEYNKTKISKELADSLNKKFEDTMMELADISEIDFSGDYWVDFNNYIGGNSNE